MHSRSGGGRFRGELLSALNGKAAFSSAACAVYWTNRSAISPMRGPVIFPARRQQSKRSKMGRSKKDAPCVGIDTARNALSSTVSLHLPREFFCHGIFLPGTCTHFPRPHTRIPSGLTEDVTNVCKGKQL